MKILHYSLGLPPYRSGGLTKYSENIILSEFKFNHEIYLLYPGCYDFSKKIKIKPNYPYRDINVYELINPSPVPLLGGVGCPKEFMQSVDINIYKNFLKEINPDIIHIHTLMGLHKEFISSAKELGIKIVYTSHDYYGICPKANLIDYNKQICKNFEDGFKCIKCNENSYSLNLIHLMQSKTYRKLKENQIIKKLRKYKKKNIGIRKENLACKNLSLSNEEKIDLAKQYKKLRAYYLEMLNLIDCIHFNSNIAKEVYHNYINNKKFEVINITHRDIKDNRVQKKYCDSQKRLNISYLGPTDSYKGIDLLESSLKDLLKKGITNWKLNVFGDDKSNSIDLNNDFYECHGKYSYSDLSLIFKKTDVLVIPSIWKETFGFIGLEALSYGVPVIISSYVGFKDLIQDNLNGLIFNPSEKSLSAVLETVISNREILNKINQNIIRQKFDYTMVNHTKDIIDLYKDVREERV